MKQKILSVLLLMAMCAALAACSGGEKTFLTQDETKAMYSDINKYKGKYVELVGKVFTEPNFDDKGVSFQMWADPEKAERNTVVGFENPQLELHKDDYVKVTGKIEKKFKGKNGFGATVEAPQIKAENVEVLSYQDAVAPTTKEVSPSVKTLEQYGYQVTVDKVELSDKETRVYVKVVNNGAASFDLYSVSALLIQNGTQYKEEGNYEADYPEVQTDLLPGLTTEGIFVFPKIEAADFKIVLDGMSDDYNEKIEDFIFDVPVQ